jgi:ASCH domain
MGMNGGGEMKGLIIKSPWIDYIFQGKKTWEIRGSNTKIRGTIALIKSGSGKVYGTVELVDCKKLSLEEYQEGERYHCIPKKECLNPRYKSIYAWVLQNPVLYDEPIPYKHPQGAVIWVNLPELKNQ